MRYRRLLPTACALLLPLFATPAQAEVYFDSNFEACTVGTHDDFPCDGWDDRTDSGGHPEWSSAPNANTFEITSTGSYSGSKSIKETFRNDGLAGDAGNKPSLYHTFPGTDHMFARALIRRDPSFETCAVNNSTKMWRFRGENINGGYPVLLLIQQSLGYRIGVEGSYGAGTVVYPGGPQVSTEWQNVEIEWKFNTPGLSDGLIRLWVDDMLYIEQLDLELRGPTPTSDNGQGQITPSDYNFNFAQVYAQCGTGSLYWDRLAVGNTRIGSASATSDLTAPASPTNFTVN